MQIKSEFRHYLEAFARLFYPAHCEVCSSALALDEWGVCRSCLAQLKVLKSPLCECCGRELPPYGYKGKICRRCRGVRRVFDKLLVFFTYEGVVQTVFKKVKFKRKRGLIRTLHPLLQERTSELRGIKLDMIVPVPLDRQRKRRREFNQSALLARQIGKLTGKPVKKGILFKKKYSKPQSQLTRKERMLNVVDAFGLRWAYSIRNKDILLVDDIITTGSTVNECAKILKQNGARCVNVFAIARTA